MLRKFNLLISERLPKTMSMHPDEIILIGKSVYFAFAQDDEFKIIYITNFVNDSCHAYSGSELAALSCTKGVKERLVLGIATTVQTLCSGADCNSTYKQLDSLLNPIDLLQAASEWVQDNKEIIKTIENDELKSRLKSFLLEKAPTREDEINVIISLLESSSQHFSDYRGGTRTRKTRKRGKTRKTRKTRTRKTMTRKTRKTKKRMSKKSI
jgi:hypothetical protein